MTYNNVVKYDGKKDKSDLPLIDNFVIFKECESTDTPSVTYYCAVDECQSFTTAELPAECVAVADAKYALPVEDGFIVDFSRIKLANNFIDAVENNEGDYVVSELVLDSKIFEEGKNAMQVVYCTMFWIIFVLVIATFVLALLSIINCRCCRCCTSIRGSIFPTR